jgi:L-seryl-tRNA(Ser) seleniumtransferase
MALTEKQQRLLRGIPGVDRILELAGTEREFELIPKNVLTRSIRKVVERIRSDILAGENKVSEESIGREHVLGMVRKEVKKAIAPNLVPLVNATGIVVHTNLGRSILAAPALENLIAINRGYSNLEFDLEKGKRGSRYSAVEDVLCEISGAESALVVNNNASAVLLCLETVAKGTEAIVSRGELVEIGGSFRIPDVMAKSGAILKEVGATNRTHPWDYENAITEKTGLLLKVHTSNYSVVGFTKSVSLKELVEIGARRNIPVMEDLGSGTFVDFSKYGLVKEPTVQESVAAGADIVTFSGDKLLGGPQAGIIVGKKAVIDRIKKNPLNRALRIDKMTLAALESTFALYREPEKAVETIPTLSMILCPASEIEHKAARLSRMLSDLNSEAMTIRSMDLQSKAGGGSLPLLNLPSKGLGIQVENTTVNAVERFMRDNDPPIVGRIEDDLFIMDLRTVRLEELETIENAFKKLLDKERE